MFETQLSPPPPPDHRLTYSFLRSLPTAEDDAAGGLQCVGDPVVVESLNDGFLTVPRAVSIGGLQRTGSGIGCTACRTVHDRVSTVAKIGNRVMSAAVNCDDRDGKRDSHKPYGYMAAHAYRPQQFAASISKLTASRAANGLYGAP
jgi:hypothetical protein